MTTDRRAGATRWVRLGVMAPLIAAAAACSSTGGGGSSTPDTSPPTSPPPPPAPPPPPPPPEPSDFETSEYFFSDGLDMIGASSAYAAGATGAGVQVAVIDSGVDASHPDLDGQVITSFDTEASRDASDVDPEGHGTLVSGVIAAQQNDVGILGTAYEADIIDIRADNANTCATACAFDDADLVTAIEFAVDNGAEIINISLGGPVDANQTLENAIYDAAAAGVLVVISSGNDGAASPDEPAYVAGDPEALGRVVAVGAIDPDGELTDFSNRAGGTQDYYILAPGDFVDDDGDGQADRGVVTTGPDDDVSFPGDPNNDPDDVGDYYFVSGTSFSAPYVSGALALLLDAFPNLTPEDALSLLLDTADDYVDNDLDPATNTAAGVGVDEVSGVGVLNLEAAFAPQGTTSLSFGLETVSLSAALAPATGAFGDWVSASGAFNDLVFQDGYQRGFRLSNVQTAPAVSRFHDFETRARFHEGAGGAVSAGGFSLDWFTPTVQFNPIEPYTPEPEASFTTRFVFDGGELIGGRGSTPESLGPSLSLLSDPASRGSELGGADVWALVGHDIGPVRAQAFSESSEDRESYGFALVRRGLGWTLRGAVVSETDEAAAFGGALQSRFGGRDASTATAFRLEGATDLGGWTWRAMAERADAVLEDIDAGGVWTSAWAVSAERPLGGGAFSLALVQPRRAEAGRLTFNAPVELTEEGELIYERRTASLTPSGREIDLEARWRRSLSQKITLDLSTALINQPDHVADANISAAAWVGLRARW